MSSDNLDIYSWATSLIDTHKNPSKHLEVIANKSVIPTNSETESALIDKHLTNVLDVCSRLRVERRCARAAGCWRPVERLVEVTKVCGLINNYGFANKSGKYLYPEEAMFLLETNRLEIFWNDVPMSIQQAYAGIIGDNLHQYLVYRKFSLGGFRLIRSSGDSDEPPNKKCRPLSSTNVSTDDVLRALQDCGPRNYEPTEVESKFDYKVFVPEQSSKKTENFKLCIR
uniref:tRNA-splicing endonuclease subunit Sen54 N-terminal domain-containing protein n=2 Tax=Photinus pyralis TaxID=7054 RepID=A0A1Y1LBY3_PHOPY